jgi:hypothetical protein
MRHDSAVGEPLPNETGVTSNITLDWTGARDLLHHRVEALAHQRDRHRVGAHAVARDAAGGVGGAQTPVRMTDHARLGAAPHSK